MAPELTPGMLSTKSEVQLKNANETKGLSDASAINSKCAVAKFPSDPFKKKQWFSCTFSMIRCSNSCI